MKINERGVQLMIYNQITADQWKSKFKSKHENEHHLERKGHEFQETLLWMIIIFFKEPKKLEKKHTHTLTPTRFGSTKFQSIDFNEYKMTNNSKSHVSERNGRDVYRVHLTGSAFFFSLDGSHLKRSEALINACY